MISSFNPTQKAPKARRVALAIGGILALATPAFAGADQQIATVETSSLWEKPAWLTDLGIRVGESYDTNVYLAGAETPAGPDVATRNKSSWATTVSPKIGVDFAKLLDKEGIIKILSLGYNPDIVLFHDADEESYVAHRVTTNFRAKTEKVTLSLENALTIIDGSDFGLRYPAGASSYANGTVRERRDQWQDRTKAFAKIDLGPVFVRPIASLLYYDLNTAFLPGYANFIDRYDVNGGLDLGYNVTKNVAFTVGYRYGHQEQSNLPVAINAAQNNASSDYQRVLFGVEGSPLKWLKVEAAVGPQFTSYTDSRPFASGIAANGKIDENPTDVYAEASVTISPTASDVLVLKYKRWNWVSSTGINAYLDTQYDASFRHQITKDLQLELGLRAANSDYNPSSYRNDWDYTASAGLKYAVTKNLGLDLTYAYDKGHNDQILGVAKPSTREFERSIVSTGVTWKF